jgi:hypothetical protein
VVVPHRGGDLSHGSAVADGSAVAGGSGVGHGSGDFSYRLHSQWFLVHDSVEPVHGISRVLHGTLGTIGVDDGVAPLDDVPDAVLPLALGVPGDAVLDVVPVGVLRVGVVVRDLGHGSGGVGQVSWGGTVRDGGGGGDHPGVRHSCESHEYDQLKMTLHV